MIQSKSLPGATSRNKEIYKAVNELERAGHSNENGEVKDGEDLNDSAVTVPSRMAYSQQIISIEDDDFPSEDEKARCLTICMNKFWSGTFSGS